MIRVKRFLYMAILVVVALAFCMGCSQERKDNQLELRAKGITHMNNGEYAKALEAFQAALDESLGQIGALELDICYYKAVSLAKVDNTKIWLKRGKMIVGNLWSGVTHN